ncbi:hypothetical protein KFE98_09515 [bacterium SCSIO 12741]|nr:hypothetical protein KFE98_09515 [bacterium SCSIO 12741]
MKKSVLLLLALLRVRQFFRQAREVGWVFIILVAGLTVGVWGRAIPFVQEADEMHMAGAGLAFALSVHLKRRDFPFLSKLQLPIRLALTVEYSLMLLPFSLLIVWIGSLSQGIAFFASGLAVVILGANTLSGRGGGKWPWDLGRYLPLDLFEWKSSLRRYPLAWVVAYGLLIFTWYHPLFLIFGVIIVLLLLLSLYEEVEPQVLFPKSATELRRKWWRQSIGLQITLFPFYLILLATRADFWFVIPVAILLLGMLQSFFLFNKYASYIPFEKALPSSVTHSVFAALLIIPGGLIINLFWCYGQYKKAVKMLTQFYA